MSFQTLPEARKSPGLASVLLNGRVLAVDPASGGSSAPGYAISHEGRFVENGVLRLPQGSLINYRLNQLLCALQATVDAYGPFDMLILEDIAIAFGGPGKKARGGAGIITRGIVNLHWACGTIVAAQPWPHVVKVTPQSWHAWLRQQEAHDTYKKADETDALCLLFTVFHQLVGRLPDGATMAMLSE